MKSVGVFMAFGTLGDVLPTAYVAAAFSRAAPSYSLAFVTHASHQILEKFLPAYGIRLYPVSTPPVLPASSAQDWLTSDLHLEECLKATEAAFKFSSGDRDFIAINFFALEGWHLCEHFNVQCVVLAPYVMPYSAPAAFERQFKKLHPVLYHHLQRAPSGKVQWEDVMHWMWPLFMDRWTSWRVNKLHLSACPLTDPVTELPVHHWPSAAPVLYGFSDEVVEVPGYWPSSVRVCGFWFPPEDSITENESFPTRLQQFLSRTRASKPLFIGLSSIGSMGLLRNAEGMLEVIRQALSTLKESCILLTAGHHPLEASINKAAGVTASTLESEGLVIDDRLFCYPGYVCYSKLLPECSVAIHHGGSGTTALCLRAGVPQIICPFVLDQFYWAERMAWIGVSTRPLHPMDLIPNETSDFQGAVDAVVAAVRGASSAKLKTNAIAVANKVLLQQNGCSNAVRILLQNVCQ